MGDWIDGEIGDDGRQVAIGKNLRQTTVNHRDTLAWREFVHRDLNAIDAKLTALQNRVNSLVLTLVILIAMSFIMAGLTVRQFDLRSVQIDSIRVRLNRLESIERIRATFPEYAPGVPREEP